MVAALPHPLQSLLRAGVLLAGAATALPAQTEYPYAAGTDAAGRAQAVSDAAGRVLIESPEFPRGVRVNLVDEGGRGLVGIHVEYEGRPDSLVALRCLDPAGLRRETVLWTLPGGDPLSLSLKSGEPADLPAGMVSIDWQIDPSVEALLESSRLAGWTVGWTAVETLLRERWQGLAGQVVVKLDDDAIVVDLDRAEAMETLMTHLEQAHQPVTGSLADLPHFGVLVDQSSNSFLGRGVILYTALFEEARLESVVRYYLDRRHGRIIQEVASLNSLRAWRRGIQSLAGIEHLVGLESLNLWRNRIVDVGPLASLANLERLNLSDNEIVEVSPLAALTNLEALVLYQNQVVILTPLAGLSGLEFLNLSDNQIVDVDPLASLTNLEWLDLSDNEIVDADPLATLTNLEELNLHSNQVVHVSPLSALTNLERLNLNANQITDVSHLASLTNLRSLSVATNQIQDIGPLESLTALEYLNLHSNQIEDISPLVANPGLGEGDEVVLQRNPLSQQAHNEQIPALRVRGVSVRY